MTTPAALTDGVLDRLRQVGAADDAPASTRYLPQELLGEGGMGAVYRCWDTVLERDVAMKIALVPPGPGSAVFAERLRSEARVLARLEHAGIVPVHDAGRLPDGRVFYVMKCIRGRTLGDMLREPMALARRLDLVERITEAVAFAHEQGVVHRDLKPANVMVGTFGDVLVTDWGVAKVLSAATEALVAPADSATAATRVRLHGASPLTDDGMVLGTAGFMAPEQARGQAATVGPSADVYSLGALLVAAITGTLPSAAVSPLTLLTTARSVPPPLRSIATRCMEPDATRRYTDAGALLEELRRFRSGERVEAHQESVLARAWRVLRPWRTPMLLVAAYLLMRMLVAWFGGRPGGLS